MRALVLFLLLAGTASAQPSRSSSASANDRAVSEALAGFDVASDGAAWDAVPAAFDALYPNTRYAQTRLTRVQARAIAFTAVTLAAGRRGPSGPSGPGYPLPGDPVSSQERARDLAFRFFAGLSGGSSVPSGAERDAAVALGTEAAGVAGAAGCTDLASALSSLTSRVRRGGTLFSSDLDAARRSAGECR